MPVKGPKKCKRKTKKVKGVDLVPQSFTFEMCKWNDILKTYSGSKKPTYKDLVTRIDKLYSEREELVKRCDDYRSLIQEALNNH